MNERLYRQSAEAHEELTAIREKGLFLAGQLSALVRAFAADYGVSPDRALDHIEDTVTDLVSDAQKPADRRKSEAEDAIANIEWAAQRRSAPVVL